MCPDADDGRPRVSVAWVYLSILFSCHSHLQWNCLLYVVVYHRCVCARVHACLIKNRFLIFFKDRVSYISGWSWPCYLAWTFGFSASTSPVLGYRRTSSLLVYAVLRLCCVNFYCYDETTWPRQPREDRAYLGRQFNRVRVQIWEMKPWLKEQETEASHLDPQALSRENALVTARGSGTLKAHLQWRHSSHKVIPPTSPWTVPPAEDQAFRSQSP